MPRKPPESPELSLANFWSHVIRSKNEVLCVAAGRLAAERSEADKPAKQPANIILLLPSCNGNYCALYTNLILNKSYNNDQNLE
jgi:hypothetical protein